MMEMDFALFQHQLRKKLQFDFSGYRDRQIQRRLRAYMQRLGLENYSALLKHLLESPKEVCALRDYLAINVSEFFRNPDMFQYLTKEIMPGLGKDGNLKMWSAGCAVGCEPYTLSILAHEHYTGSWSILATDIDGGAIAQAQEGVYDTDLVKSVPRQFMRKYFERCGEREFRIIPSLKENVRFKRLDLLTESYPRGLDLILCRNVVIYFTEKAKTKILASLSQSLRPGGVIFIGATESFYDYQAYQLKRVHPCFYQKV